MLDCCIFALKFSIKMANIILIETSTKACSVSLCKDFNIEFHEEELEGPNHAASLGMFVERVMEHARQNNMMPDAVAVSAGPGSYTGLRIGISEAKGLAFGLNVPLIAVDTLKTMCCRIMFANNIEDDALYCPMIDARRMEVYTALYDRALNAIKPVSSEIIGEDFLKEELDKHPIYFFGDGSEKCEEIIKHPNAHFIKGIRAMASDMMALAIQAYNRQDFVDVAYFTPFYLKDFVAKMPKNPLEELDSKMK